MVMNRIDELLEWLRTASDNDIKQTGVSRNYLRLVAYGHKRPSARVATSLEQLSGKEITRQMLRPDDWEIIWPELVRPPRS